jgi:hypothetical protein
MSGLQPGRRIVISVPLDPRIAATEQERFLTLRAEGNANGEERGRIANGQTVTVGPRGTIGAWTHVTTADGQEGYIRTAMYGRNMFVPAPAESGAAPRAEPGLQAGPTALPDRCGVISASYGGGNFVVIRGVRDGETQYHVLEINSGTPGREKITVNGREVEKPTTEVADYISTHIPGGEILRRPNGDMLRFTSFEEASTRPLEVCPIPEGGQSANLDKNHPLARATLNP